VIGLRPFFTYFGGKWRVALRYPAPEYSMIIEPFAGAAGYSLRHPDRQIFLNDLNEEISSLWEYLIHVTEREIRSLPVVFETTRNLRCCQEAKILIGFWLNKGSSTGRHFVPSAWMRAGAHQDSFWGAAIRERIASQIQYIRHWKISNRPFERIGNRKATWFIDPPYHRTKGYKYQSIDYALLAEYAKNRRGQVICCEQDGADWLPFKPFITLKGLEGRYGGKQSKEWIWTNENRNRIRATGHGEDDALYTDRGQ